MFGIQYFFFKKNDDDKHFFLEFYQNRYNIKHHVIMYIMSIAIQNLQVLYYHLCQFCSNLHIILNRERVQSLVFWFGRSTKHTHTRARQTRWIQKFQQQPDITIVGLSTMVLNERQSQCNVYQPMYSFDEKLSQILV